MGLLHNVKKISKTNTRDDRMLFIMSKRECSKQLVQSSPELVEGKAAHGFPRSAERYPCLTTRAYGTVREDGKASTCLRVAAFSLRSYFGEGGSAKAGNAPGGLFQHFHYRLLFFGRNDEYTNCGLAR